MRICFIAGNIYPLLAQRPDLPIVGGAEVQQSLIAGELLRRGLEICFVTEEFGQGPAVKVGSCNVYSYLAGKGKGRKLSSLASALAKADADLYYVRGAPRFLAWIALFCLLKRRPLVIGMSTNYNVYPPSLTGMPAAEHLAYRWSLERAAAVVVQTEFQRSRLAVQYGIGSAVRILSSAQAGDPVPADPESRRFIAWIASLHRYKGVESVFDLARKLKGRRFVVAGGPARGEEAYYREMEAQAGRLPNLRWLGMQRHDQIESILRESLALINTTQPYRGIPNLEGFPSVYPEAWRNAVPTLTLYNDPDEVICREGLGFHSRSVEQMAIDLESLLGDTALWRHTAEACCAYFDSNHTLARVGDEYYRLFTRLGRASSASPDPSANSM